MRKGMFVLGAALLCALALRTPAQALGIGDPAPKLAVKEFVKGEPVKEFAKGKKYVVEFWATWCGPCRTSIPHLTEMQKKYKDVTFIGVSVWETSQTAVKPFVKDMGDKMDYRVAMDIVPEGGKGEDGEMAKTWMTAAGQNGIPAAFIVNEEGKIAWVGHPMTMEKPLDQVVAGKWDIEKAKKGAELDRQMRSAQKSGDTGKMLQLVDQAIKEDADQEQRLGIAKFFLMMEQNSPEDKTAEYGKHLVQDVLKDAAPDLNQLAWSLVDPDAPKKAKPKLLKVALMAAQRADTLMKGKDPAIADTLGKAYFDNGNIAKAVETQERAVKLAKGTEFEKDKSIQERLDEYKKALKK